MGSKVAIVTGASSGIGLGVVRRLLDRGYAVVGASREATRKTPLAPTKDLLLIDADVGSAAAAARVVEATVSTFGRVDVLVNNAGLFIAKPFTDYTEDDYARLLSTNVGGFFHMTRLALRPMVAQNAGHIVNISTSLASQPVAGVPSALPIITKGGIEAATRSLAIEYAGHGIRVNTVAAGIIDTPLHPKANHGFLKSLSPAQRIGTVDEIADAILYLDGATFVSGEILHVDGGAHAGKW